MRASRDQLREDLQPHSVQIAGLRLGQVARM